MALIWEVVTFRRRSPIAAATLPNSHFHFEEIHTMRIHIMRLFFCHSSKDKPFVRELIDLLPEVVRSWVDENELHAGQSIKDILRTAIESSDFVVAILSSDSIRSDWVKYELKTAMKNESTRDRILPIVIDDTLDRIPGFIRGRKYLYLHDRSQGQVKEISKQLLESVVFFVVENDPMISLFREQSDMLRIVAPVRAGRAASTIGPELHELVPKKIRAIYQKIYGIETKEQPPWWLVSLTITSAESLRAYGSEEQAMIAAWLVEHRKSLIDQCFLIGYYAMSLRRGIVGIKIDDGKEYDAGEICKVFDEIVKDFDEIVKENPEVDEAVWNLGVHWVSIIYGVLVEKGILPSDEYVEKALIKSMCNGMIMSRAVERIASGA